MRLIRRALFLLLPFLMPALPVAAGISVINGLTHAYRVKEGMPYKGYIEIQNTGTDKQSVRISKNDFLCDSSGQIFYEEPGRHNRSNASWVELKATSIVLEAGEKYQLTYQVSIPRKLELSGSYWCVVMIEPVDELKAVPQENGVQVLTRVRYAVQVVCTTGEPAKAEVRFKKTEVANVEGRRYLVVDLEDTGELYHTVVVNAEFFDAQTGGSSGIYKSQLQSIFPYTSRRFMIDITGLGVGEYKGILLADCSEDQVFGLNVSLNIRDE